MYARASVKKSSKSNPERSTETRTALKAAARALFLEFGFAATGTEQIVNQSGVTRGALYYHYADKRDLFAEIVEEELAVVAARIEDATGGSTSAMTALKRGAKAFITAMAEAGRTRLVLLEAPTVLGRDRLLQIENRHARGSLTEGLEAAMAEGSIGKFDSGALVEILSAAFDGAALAVESGIPNSSVDRIIQAIFDGLS